MRFLFGQKSKQRLATPEDTQKEVAVADPATNAENKEVVATGQSHAKNVQPEITDTDSNAIRINVVENHAPFLEEKKIERNKASDRSLFKGLLSSLYDAVLIIDNKGFVIESNPRAEEFFGFSKAELWNMPCADLISAMNLRVLAKLQTHSQNGKFTVVNTNCKCRNGTSFPAEITINRINLLPEGDLLFCIRNLKKRKKVDNDREYEHQALEHAGIGIAFCNENGRVEYANPTLVRMLQCETVDELLGVNITDFCNSSDDVNKLLLKNEG